MAASSIGCLATSASRCGAFQMKASRFARSRVVRRSCSPSRFCSASALFQLESVILRDSLAEEDGVKNLARSMLSASPDAAKAVSPVRDARLYAAWLPDSGASGGRFGCIGLRRRGPGASLDPRRACGAGADVGGTRRRLTTRPTSTRAKSMFGRQVRLLPLHPGEQGASRRPQPAWPVRARHGQGDELQLFARTRRISNTRRGRRTCIDQWLVSPQGFVPGTSMFFNGLKEPSERRDLIAYLLMKRANN